MELNLNRCANRADIRAGTAIFAEGGFNHIDVTLLGDGAFGTFGLAGSTGDAVIGNFVGHGLKSFQ
jgi:hypothetical protein